MADRIALRGGVRLVAGILLSLWLIALLFRNVSWADLWRNVTAFPSWAILASGSIVLLSVPLRTIQWYCLLGEWEQLTWVKVFRALCLGHVGNFFLPMRGGEFLKAGVLCRSAAMPLERVLASIVLCRLQDLIPISGIFLFFLLNADLRAMEAYLGLEPGELVKQLEGYAASVPWILGLVVLAAVCAIVVAMWWLSKRPRQLITKESRIKRWAIERAIGVFDAVLAAGHPLRFLGAFLAAVGCWLLFTLASVPLLLSLGLNWIDSLRSALVITGATTFFQLLPSAPTAAGTFHLGCTLALASAIPELDTAQALAFALVLHGVGAFAPVLPSILLIPTYLYSDDVSQIGKAP